MVVVAAAAADFSDAWQEQPSLDFFGFVDKRKHGWAKIGIGRKKGKGSKKKLKNLQEKFILSDQNMKE